MTRDELLKAVSDLVDSHGGYPVIQCGSSDADVIDATLKVLAEMIRKDAEQWDYPLDMRMLEVANDIDALLPTGEVR